jgi:hypothetical protein
MSSFCYFSVASFLKYPDSSLHIEKGVCAACCKLAQSYCSTRRYKNLPLAQKLSVRA